MVRQIQEDIFLGPQDVGERLRARMWRKTLGRIKKRPHLALAFRNGYFGWLNKKFPREYQMWVFAGRGLTADQAKRVYGYEDAEG